MTQIVSRDARALRRVLFACRDNFSISRFCEEYFNSLVRDEGINWQASSRALLRPHALPKDQATMAGDAVRALRELRAAPVAHERAPISLAPKDLEITQMLVLIGVADVRPEDVHLEQAPGRGTRSIDAVDWALPSGAGARDIYLLLARRLRALVATLEAPLAPIGRLELASAGRCSPTGDLTRAG